jgi:hypothetical protein
VTSRALVDLLSYVECGGCATVLIVMYLRRQVADYKPLALFLCTRILSIAIGLPLLAMGGHQIPIKIAYPIYFWFYWSCYAVEALLGFFVIFSIYNLAMAPLPGLQRLGTLMFRWAAGIAVAIAFTTALGPHLTSHKFIPAVVTQLQQTQSIITLCLLLFVCLAIRPMGLSYRSKIFGVSLGLGVLATADLATSAWLSHFTSMYSVVNIVNGGTIFVTLLIWTTYFAVPEPKRRMIILPTTSPFLRWNQISLALGDEPGFVAIGNVTPEMFAPAEVEVMRRASLKMHNNARMLQSAEVSMRRADAS